MRCLLKTSGSSALLSANNEHRQQISFDTQIRDIEKKGKAVPLKAWSGSEGSRKLSYPDFMPTLQNCGNVVKHYAPAAFTPENTSGNHFC